MTDQPKTGPLIDDLARELGHLQAMLLAVSGGGAEAFDELRPELRDHYLCACADKAQGAVRMVAQLAAAAVPR